MQITDFFIGIIMGVITSYFVWWLLTRATVPKVTFAPFISKIQDTEDKSRYRIGFKNSGRRTIIDVQIIVELVIKGFDTKLPNNTSYIQLNLHKPKLYKVSKGTRWALTIDLNKLPNSLSVYKNATLEDLLKIKNAKVRIIIFGYDEYSGSRKILESDKYTFTDIKEEKFESKYYE